MAESSSAAKRDGEYQVTLDEALELAKGHHMSGNFVLADRTYRDILRAVPDHFPTVHLLGVLLFQTGNLMEAENYLQKSVKQAPQDKQCWNNLAAVMTDLQKCEEALNTYDKALSIDPEFTEALNNKALTLWMLGHPEEAEKSARKSLTIKPGNLDGLVSLGIALSAQKKYEEAVDIWEIAATAHPDASKVWVNWGNTLRDMGQLGESEIKCRKALELDPQNPDTLNNLGNSLRDRGEIKEAIEYYRQATNLKPEHAEAHNNMAIALCDLGRYEEAVVAARYAAAFKKDSASIHTTLSQALRQMGDFTMARAAAQKAIYLAPDDADPYLELAEANLSADILEDAEAALQEALKREPDSARTYKKLADLRERLTDHKGALEAINKAIDMAPGMPMLWISKAQIHQLENDMSEAFAAVDKAAELAPQWHLPLQVKAEMLITVNENKQAEEYVRRALELNPNVPGPYATLTSLKKFESEEDENFIKMKSLLDREMTWGLSGAAVLHYGLSDAYAQMKDYDMSFEHLKKANEYRRKTIPINPAKALEVAEAIKTKFTTPFLKNLEGKGFKSDIPVFIVGMPRSGTTLTEQIISSHPLVFGAGELTEISHIREEMGGLGEDNAYEFGKQYIERVKMRDPSGKAERITDKMPGNYMNLGLIRSILPDAKIIHCRRDPVDTCVSCFQQNFASGQYWSYDLEDLAAEYNRYLDMMNHWRSVMPGQFLEIRYEETVENFEEQARKLIDYVGLEWNAACLEPHKQKRTVLTASKAQVTQPIYKSSVQKWRRYEKHLGPLLDNLNQEAHDYINGKF